jgi:acyl-CoA synthetase (AMP-forming)/AMP-acid ligase II/thioesterase domain-containing protein/acyl carrier protein
MSTDLLTQLRQVAAADPSRIALCSVAQPPASFGGLVDQLDAVMATFRRAGVTWDSRVATLLPNAPDTAVAILALAASAIAVPLNPAMTGAELAQLLGAAEVTHLLARRGDRAAAALAASLGRGLIALEPAAVGPTGSFTLHVDPVAAPVGNAEASAHGVALVLHTSGSTGAPKRVPLTVENLRSSAVGLARSLALSPEDTCLNMMPMFHIGALVDLLLAPLGAGGAVAFAGEISANAFFAALDGLAPSWFQAVPTVLRDILAHEASAEERMAVGRLRFVRAVSQPLPPPLQAEFEQRFGVPVVPIFGMTETAGLIASVPLGVSRPGSVGIGFGTEIGIADSHGNLVPAGRRGEVLVAGPNVMAGYEGENAARTMNFYGEWLRTGDEGFLDETGFLYLTGRLKDVINRGGEKISPIEIEGTLAGHPQVREAAAFALPHPSLGEEPGLAVVAAPGATLREAEIIAFLRARLAPHQLPRRVLLVDRLPRLASGKLNRLALPALAGAAPQTKPRTAPATPLARSVAALWRRVLEVDDVALEDDFFDLGGDSLRATTLAMLLEERFGPDLGVADLFDAPTLADMAARLARGTARGLDETPLDPAIRASLARVMAGWQGRRLPGSLLVGRHTLGIKRPFFWVPQSHHGFEAIADRLDPERPVYGMTSLSLTRLKSDANTRHLARYYAGEIVRIQPEGPYLVGGFCQGGVVAFHIARALRALGQEVALLVLQDRFIPEPYDGEIALFWGKHGSYCAYFLNHQPERAWAKYYSGPVSVFTSEADHHDLHNPPFADEIARTLEAEFARVERGAPPVRPCPLEPLPPLDPAARKFALHVAMPAGLRQGGAYRLPVTLTNRSSLPWSATAGSGLVVSARWRVLDRESYVLDGWAALPHEVRPGETVTVEVPVRVPMRSLPVVLQVDLVEDGMLLGGRVPRAAFNRLVLARRPKADSFVQPLDGV